jgi:hypothetical protein
MGRGELRKLAATYFQTTADRSLKKRFFKAWDSQTGKEVFRDELAWESEAKEKTPLSHFCVSPNGQLIARAYKNGYVRVQSLPKALWTGT